LGEVFRVFTRGYERRVKQDVVGESDRRLWGELLKQLAARMMTGEKPTELRVAIGDGEIYEVFSSYLNTSDPLVPRQALDDLLRHHLIQRNGELVEFRHQLIQEYYAAEWLLERVGRLDDETLKGEFLNYLKWTESVALMLALVEDEALAVRVVELALDVDLMLGARLAGEVRSGFQERTVGFILKLKLPSKLWVSLLTRTESTLTIPELINMLGDEDSSVRFTAANALGKLKSDMAIPGLTKLLNDQRSYVYFSAIDALNKISIESLMPILIQNLKNTDMYIRLRTIDTLILLSSEMSIPVFIKALQDPDIAIRQRVIYSLAQFKTQEACKGIIQGLMDEHRVVREQAITVLGQMKDELFLPNLLEGLQDCDPSVRKCSVDALGELKISKGMQGLLMALKDEDDSVRWSAVISLGRISDKRAIDELLKVVEDENFYVRRSAAHVLKELWKDNS
jgi:HEAT repeat protein